MKKYAQIITKKQITDHIYQRSNEVATDFYREFGGIIDDLANDIAISFTILADATDRDSKDELSDADFQSAHLFWTALNTILSAMELFIRGYSKEPAVLTRSALEVASVACDLHLNPSKLSDFRLRKFKSTESISVVKAVLPVIGSMYGQLSDIYAHVSLIHSLPQGSYQPNRKTMWIGGGFSKEHKKFHLLALSNLVMTIDVVNELLEFVLRLEIPDRRFWQDVDDGYAHKPLERIRVRSMSVADQMKKAFEDETT